MDAKLALTIAIAILTLAGIGIWTAWSIRSSTWRGKKQPQRIPAAVMARVRQYDTARRVTGWGALALFLLAFILQDTQSWRPLLAAATTVLGVWFVIRQYQMMLVGQYEDLETGVVFFGKPARVDAIIGLVFGIGAMLVGVYGLVSELF